VSWYRGLSAPFSVVQVSLLGFIVLAKRSKYWANLLYLLSVLEPIMYDDSMALSGVWVNIPTCWAF
jgi:hypothetical protein